MKALGALALAGALLAFPAAAGATTLSPAGHVIELGSQPVTIGPWIACTLDGGEAAIPAAPANSNPSGPVTVPFTVRPTLSACTFAGTPAPSYSTSGTWKLTVDYAWPAPKFSITVPAGGINAACGPLPNGAPATSLSGTWQNGADGAPSTAQFGFADLKIAGWCGGIFWRFEGDGGSLLASDATDPAQSITVTP